MADDPLREWYNEDGTRTAKCLAKDVVAMSQIVTAITQTISGNINTEYSEEQKKSIVFDHYTGLENFLGYSDWNGNEDFTDANKAVTDGKAYVG
tara:strand:- start:61 stop:342 length:282 start_codon:yes stop_codon:yes gene_type:complete